MEFPLAQICPQGSHEPLSPTSGTFQPMDLTCRSFQGLSSPPEPRGHTWKAEEAPRSLRAPTAHTEASAQTTAAASILGDAGRPEKVSGEESSPSLQAETRAWFQKTQAPQLLQQGAAPAWFHGFITRREAERLLESQPQGCYLVRFSESAVTFVLTYRSQTCCRHFLLAQLRDGRHVVLGEDSAHARLQDLLSHYTTRPLIPYGETLTQPLARQTPDPAGLSLRSEEPNSGCKSQDPIPQHNPFIKQEQDSALVHKEGSLEPKEVPFQPPRPKPPIPAKPQPPHKVYASPKRRPCPALPPKPTNPIYHEPDEPIAFYAMGWGSPGEAPSNIYAEVEGPPETVSIKHPVLRKCQSRPVPGHQVKQGFRKSPKFSPNLFKLLVALGHLLPGLVNINSLLFPAAVGTGI
ncbi:SH2 domain-containing protein 2A [Perognathus longimembris pacificus]|uniref:SH2 domain-containing protein 2A n=1 Tax=Perognathus longimembris pacificus TaxID=214514 RepID=UPI0020193B1E|nr:SH2 domain-containing protein 2A [Perognathus longimembris pacificus]